MDAIEMFIYNCSLQNIGNASEDCNYMYYLSMWNAQNLVPDWQNIPHGFELMAHLKNFANRLRKVELAWFRKTYS